MQLGEKNGIDEGIADGWILGTPEGEVGIKCRRGRWRLNGKPDGRQHGRDVSGSRRSQSVGARLE
jgi:hypothetical protein